MSMTSQRHIWACDNTLIQQHRDDAWFHALVRADELLTAGDLDGYKMFRAILSRIEELQRTKLIGSVQ